MIKIVNLIRVGLASLVLLTTSTQVWAQVERIYGPRYADCGQTATYSASYNEQDVDSYSWRFVYSDGTIDVYSYSSIRLTLPNTSGTVDIDLIVYLKYGGGRRDLSFRTDYGNPPDKPETILGPTAVCGISPTGTYSVDPVDGATEYRWRVSSPYRIIHPASFTQVTTYQGPESSVMIQFPSSGSVTNGWIEVAAISGGTCSAISPYKRLDIVFGPQTYPITGPPSIAQNSVVAFEVNGANLSNFSWSTPGGINILSGANTQRIVVEAPTVTSGNITVTYRSCGVLRSQSKYVTVSGTSGGGPGFGGFARNALLEDETVIGLASIYPNPATDEVTVTSGKPLEQVMVVNLMGQVIKQMDVVSGNTVSLKLQDLKAGTYFVIALDGEGKHTHQLVIE